jgi:hypothetical protein
LTKTIRRQAFCILTLIFIVACNSETPVYHQPNCFIRYDSLFKTIDTTNLEIVQNTDSAAIEVLDKSVSDGQRGLLRFDDKNNLRYYAFLKNEDNDASFIMTYDSIGTRNRWTNAEVVQWNFYNTKDTAIKFTFLLCALDRNYGDIEIESGRFRKVGLQLFESKFTKLICATVSINLKDIDKTGKIYIRGRWQDKCSKVEKNFIDSTTVPFEQLTYSVQHQL